MPFIRELEGPSAFRARVLLREKHRQVYLGDWESLVLSGISHKARPEYHIPSTPLPFLRAKPQPVVPQSQEKSDAQKFHEFFSPDEDLERRSKIPTKRRSCPLLEDDAYLDWSEEYAVSPSSRERVASVLPVLTVPSSPPPPPLPLPVEYAATFPMFIDPFRPTDPIFVTGCDESARPKDPADQEEPELQWKKNHFNEFQRRRREREKWENVGPLDILNVEGEIVPVPSSLKRKRYLPGEHVLPPPRKVLVVGEGDGGRITVRFDERRYLW